MRHTRMRRLLVVAGAVTLLCSSVVSMSAAGDVAKEIVIDRRGPAPDRLTVGLDAMVTFVNRTGRSVHVDFVGDSGQHHVFQVPGHIQAIFHRPGIHPYVVHFFDGAVPELYGVVEVLPATGHTPSPPVCGRVTVQEICLED